MRTTFPEIVEPFSETELMAITAMKVGTMLGGCELAPGPVVQVPLTIGGVELNVAAKP